ncbi:MAG: glycosyltransferase [Planctomycetota bacterium]|jgi:hypothetical protein
MKRILYLSRSGTMGGSQRQLYYLVTSLAQTYEPIVVCPENGQFVDKLKDEGIATHILQMHPWRKFSAGLYRYLDADRLTRFAKKNQVALVHSSDLWLSNYMVWVARKLQIPSVLHIRTTIAADKVSIYRYIEKVCLPSPYPVSLEFCTLLTLNLYRR